MAQLKKSPAVLPLQKRVLYGSTAGLWLSGVIWFYLPIPGLLKMHGALAFVFLMVFGTMLFEHVPAGWAQKEHRPSGLSVVGTCGFLIASGWGLYYIGQETVRLGLHWSHLVVGAVLPILIYLHVQVKRRTRGPVLEPTRRTLKN